MTMFQRMWRPIAFPAIVRAPKIVIGEARSCQARQAWILKGAWADGVLCLLATVFALSIAEVSLRFIGLGHPIIYERSVLWGYSPVRDQSERRFDASRVTIDRNGFRISEPLQGDQHILFFGDSITYGGSYIDDTQIFSSLTCDMLNADYSSSKYSCANAAVNAYGIRNMLSRARYVEKQFPSAIMVLTVISEDFYRNFSQLSGLPYFTTKPPEPFPATFELLAYSLDSIRTWARFGDMLDVALEENSPARLEVDAAVDLVNAFLKGRRQEGRETLVVWSPSRDWFTGTNGAQERYPYERLRQLGTDFIDMTPALKQSKATASQIYYDDAHLQRDGHRVYAQAIAGVLHKRSQF